VSTYWHASAVILSRKHALGHKYEPKRGSTIGFSGPCLCDLHKKLVKEIEAS
jgi:hypothetical protein